MQPPLTERALHVHCGDWSAATLRASGVPGTVVVNHDPACFGPTPCDVSGAAWYRMRAEYLNGAGVPSAPSELAAGLQAEDRLLEDLSPYDEVVLWFDHCLFDQSILIRLLSLLSSRPDRSARVSLICIGEFPGFAKFRGLGELSAVQMASLAAKRHEVTLAEYGLAVAAWSAFRSSDARAIEQLVAGDTSALPYLAPAAVRQLEQFPSELNGLDRLEHEAVCAAAAGHGHPVDLFRAVSDMEERPFMGDTTLWECVDRLASADAPALSVSGPGPIPRWNPPADLSPWHVTATDFGRDLLSGRADWVRRNGVERWVGGVHLSGREVACRWDGQARRLRR